MSSEAAAGARARPAGATVNRRGVCYDVGAVTDMDWRADFDPRIVKREFEF